MPRSRFRSPAAALVAALALGAAGCGVSVDDSAAGPSGVEQPTEGRTAPPIEPGSFEGTGGAVYLREAVEATEDVTTQKMSMTMEMEGMPGGTLSISTEGAFDNETGQGHLTMDMGDMMGQLPDDGSLPDDAGLMEMVIDGDTTYVKSPLFSMMSEDDAEWLSVATDELDDSGSMSGGQSTDPTEFLKYFEATGDEITEVGTEEVRGVETTHLRTNLDLRKMMEEASGEEREELEADLEDLGGAAEAFSSLPADAWIDEDGYVRKFQMVFDLSGIEDAPEGMDGFVMTVTVELYDFNEPVDIEIPDPADVGELDPSLLED